MTVGISAVNIRNSIQKKRKLVLFITLVASLPIPRYNRPIRIPTVKWEINRNLVNVCKEKGKKLYLLVPCFYYVHCLKSLYYMCWFFLKKRVYPIYIEFDVKFQTTLVLFLPLLDPNNRELRNKNSMEHLLQSHTYKTIITHLNTS